MADHSLLDTTFPVLLPKMPKMHLDKPDFEEHIKALVTSAKSKTLPVRGSRDSKVELKDAAVTATEKALTPATKSDEENEQEVLDDDYEAPFMTALLKDKAAVPSFDSRDGKMLTENADVAYKTSGKALVDAFFEVEDVISGNKLKDVLDLAWKDDADATLKIIWNARSIHLGKSSRKTFYRALGWLAEDHPLTLISNLPWLVRPIIQKKALSKEKTKRDDTAASNDAEMIEAHDADSDFEVIDEKGETQDGEPKQKKLKLDEDAELVEFDVKYGVAHGYWKDLLNILALAVNDELKVDGRPSEILNVEKPPSKKYKRDWTEGRKKATINERHQRVVQKLKNDGFYKALHQTIARLFADQLRIDLARLKSDDKAEKKKITLAAKWAPTHKGMHDQHTCIVTSIAELLHSFDSVCPEGTDPSRRKLYLKYARIAYQSQTLSPLRKYIDIVERYITEEKFKEIKYDRVPSLAMHQYTKLFAKKDFEHFDQYIEKVASGQAKISGATLLPSTLISEVLPNVYAWMRGSRSDTKKSNAMVEQKLRDIQMRTIDAQWNTLVQRIKDSGTLSDSIAVCDVSGSMHSPRFSDGSSPICSSIGLSLLLAEVTKPPFGGAFITFSEEPAILRVGGKDDKRSLKEKVGYINGSTWSMNTNFVAVFEDLILPMAIENKLSQEDMVKQVFVFSDMQFDQAGADYGGGYSSVNKGGDRWTTSFERIQKKFKDAGYEMPRLIFWDLAGGRAGYDDGNGGDDTAPKPVTAAEENTALVSGYSQGQMKMFLENGSFEDDEEEEEVVEEEGEDGEVVVQVKKEKKKQDPLEVVKKAIGHEAYRMLKVVD